MITRLPKKRERPRPKRDVMDRLWDLTMPIPESGCYVFMGAISLGYGYIMVFDEATQKWRNRRAYRVAYERLVGPVPKGLELDHKCRVRSCWRPDHLEAVTKRENILRGCGPTALQARRTHCKLGHELTVVGNRRRCLICRKRNDAKRYPRNNKPAQ